jgi:Fe-S-cluster-containing dehydrogenase component/DMSO reductase anchor subunit
MNRHETWTRDSSGDGVALADSDSARVSLPILNGSGPLTLSYPRTFTPSHPGDVASLVDLLLADQQRLSAVDLFSREHEHGTIPAQAKHYSKLLPATPPGPGQQYAFDVDLDCCSGCKACVTACHSLNGLDENETWRNVGLLVGGTSHNPVMQHVTTACHHCLEPACMIACPVDAYEKDPQTGIVKHLDDQCFGCQYCTLACPYDVPKYHAAKGIVRKCDMCSDRLAAGEAPACVQACPHEAISIRVVNVEQVVEDSEADNFLPAAPEPHVTLPTTTYRTKRVFPRNMLPADYHSVSPQHPHWPLIVMLVLTQLSVGAFAVGVWLDASLPAALADAFRPVQAIGALTFGLLALAASTLHLGRPQYAYRAIVGLRHSWLSREIVAFGAFAGLAVMYAGACWWGGYEGMRVRGYEGLDAGAASRTHALKGQHNTTQGRSHQAAHPGLMTDEIERTLKRFHNAAMVCATPSGSSAIEAEPIPRVRSLRERPWAEMLDPFRVMSPRSASLGMSQLGVSDFTSVPSNPHTLTLSHPSVPPSLHLSVLSSTSLPSHSHPHTLTLSHSPESPTNADAAFRTLIRALGWSVTLAGAAGVFCSAMIYVFTRRELWSFGRTMTRFTLTGAVLGLAATWLTVLLVGRGDGAAGVSLGREIGPDLCRLLLVFAGAKLLFEGAIFYHLTSRRMTSIKRSAQLMLGPLSNVTLARFGCGLVGGILMPAFLFQQSEPSAAAEVTQPVVVGMLFAACLAGELLERRLFFAAVAAPRMPGSVGG